MRRSLLKKCLGQLRLPKSANKKMPENRWKTKTRLKYFAGNLEFHANCFEIKLNIKNHFKNANSLPEIKNEFVLIHFLVVFSACCLPDGARCLRQMGRPEIGP